MSDNGLFLRVKRKNNIMTKKSSTKINNKSTRKVNFLKPVINLFKSGNNRLRLSVGSILGLVSIYQLLSFLS